MITLNMVVFFVDKLLICQLGLLSVTVKQVKTLENKSSHVQNGLTIFKRRSRTYKKKTDTNYSFNIGPTVWRLVKRDGWERLPRNLQRFSSVHREHLQYFLHPSDRRLRKISKPSDRNPATSGVPVRTAATNAKRCQAD